MMPRFHLLLSLGIAATALAFSAAMYPLLPEPAPTHWNIHGEVDGHGPAWISAFLMPLIMLATIGLFVVLPWLGPFRRNFDTFRVTYGRFAVLIAAMFAALHATILLAASGIVRVDIGGAFSVILGVAFIFMGNWMSKLRRNFYIGIRTPWTLANETVWERTHRLGGRLFAAQGLLMAVTGLLAPSWLCFVVTIGGLVVVAAWSIVYSLVLYKRLGDADDLAERS